MFVGGIVYKFCVSGPAVSGKTFCIKNHLDKNLDLVTVDESSRKVYSMYPELPSSDIRKFREKICEHQRHLEVIVDNLISSDDVIVCDRGVFDNLAFLLLYDEEMFHKELEIALGMYKDGLIKLYDKILYFDVDLIGVDSQIFSTAFEDPLRKFTIDVDNYAKHVLDFKNAFANTIGCFRHVLDIEMVTFTAKPTEQDFDLRNKQVLDYIMNSI